VENGVLPRFPVKYLSSIAVCLGVVVGFVTCSLIGRATAHKNIYSRFLRLHPYLEQETAYYPTASELVAVAHAQCPASSDKVLVVIGGNSVFNGSGQKHGELWSTVLQSDLGPHYHVVNFSAPGAGVVDNGGVIFEALATEYPRSIFVANAEPGYFPAANRSAYAYLFWDAYYKGLLPKEAEAVAQNMRNSKSADEREFELGRWLNSYLYFNDLWTDVAYQYGSGIWTSWLQGRSFSPRRSLRDWYDKRPRVVPSAEEFAKLLPGHIEALRRRRTVAPDCFQQNSDGSWVQTAASLHQDEEQIAALLPDPLKKRSLIVLTPYNPWFLAHLTEAERSRVTLSFHNSADLLEKAGFHVLSTLDRGFELTDFGDTVHLSPAGGQRIAHLVAEAIRTREGDGKSASGK
jgi:lysophospholipase L1-like esterase